jgi:hypothetical protein
MLPLSARSPVRSIDQLHLGRTPEERQHEDKKARVNERYTVNDLHPCYGEG